MEGEFLVPPRLELSPEVLEILDFKSGDDEWDGEDYCYAN
jgi:hypothetical protein